MNCLKGVFAAVLLIVGIGTSANAQQMMTVPNFTPPPVTQAPPPVTRAPTPSVNPGHASGGIPPSVLFRAAPLAVEILRRATEPPPPPPTYRRPPQTAYPAQRRAPVRHGRSTPPPARNAAGHPPVSSYLVLTTPIPMPQWRPDPDQPPPPKPVPDLRPDEDRIASAEAAHAAQIWPGEIVVRLPAGSPDTLGDDVAEEFDLDVLRRSRLAALDIEIVTFAIPDGRSVGEVQAALRDDPRGLVSQPNFVYGLTGADSPQYALTSLQVGKVHPRRQGRGIAIAVIDSAVDADSFVFEGVVAKQFDATGGRADADGVADEHGTAIAGIIAANGNLTGVAPQAAILAVRAFWTPKAGGAATSSSEVIARAVDWAISQKASVLNMSFAGPEDGLVADVIAAARDGGAVAVAAAGNGGPDAPPAYPGALDSVIAVTATDAAEAVYERANAGTYVDIAAPGVDVLVAGRGGTVKLMSGTSMAAAHISGLVALMAEEAGPLSFEAAMAALTATARDLGDEGIDTVYGAGLAVAPDAVGAAGQTPARVASGAAPKQR